MSDKQLTLRMQCMYQLTLHVLLLLLSVFACDANKGVGLTDLKKVSILRESVLRKLRQTDQAEVMFMKVDMFCRFL